MNVETPARRTFCDNGSGQVRGMIAHPPFDGAGPQATRSRPRAGRIAPPILVREDLEFPGNACADGCVPATAVRNACGKGEGRVAVDAVH